MAKDLQMHATKLAPFEVYRYQLVVNKSVQLTIDSDYSSASDIRAHKNEIFANVIGNERFRFAATKSEITSKHLFSHGDLHVFKMGVKRSIKISRKDFSEDDVENYPNILIAVNNDPKIQKIAIQKSQKAFRDTISVSHIIEQSLDNKLKRENLSFYIEPMFDKQEFWNLVKRHRGKITQLTFDLVSPNMANISKNLKVDLKKMYKDTNTHKTRLQFNSDKANHLEINENSDLINSLVDYSSEGAGNIAMRVKGLRQQLHTAQSVTEFSIDEQLLKSKDWDALDEAFREILI